MSHPPKRERKEQATERGDPPIPVVPRINAACSGRTHTLLNNVCRGRTFGFDCSAMMRPLVAGKSMEVVVTCPARPAPHDRRGSWLPYSRTIFVEGDAKDAGQALAPGQCGCLPPFAAR